MEAASISGAETFRDWIELREAILAAREAAGPEMVLAAHVSVEEDGTLADGASTEEFTRRLDEWPVDVSGLNCSSGPRAVLETIEKMAGLYHQASERNAQRGASGAAVARPHIWLSTRGASCGRSQDRRWLLRDHAGAYPGDPGGA